MNKPKSNFRRIDALTDEDIDKAVAQDPDAAPVLESLEGFQRYRGPQKAPTKQPVSIRLSPEVIEYFKKEGPGWQSRIDEALKNMIKESGGK